MKKRIITASLVGLPNAGKSTLINKIVGQKISITSPKSQTTRLNIMGIKNVDECQIIFTDTPGFKDSRNPLEKGMKKLAMEAIESCDITCVILDAKKLCRYGLEIDRLPKNIKGAIFLLNKIDKVKNKKELLQHIKSVGDAYEPSDLFLISATRSIGIDDFLQKLCSLATEGPWLFENDEVTDITERTLAEEITREKLFYEIRDEIPYLVEVMTEKWQEDGDDLYISQTIFVRKDSHKIIVIGSGAENIKKIGEKSRMELSKLFGKKVRLFLHVRLLNDTIVRDMERKYNRS